MLHSLAFGSFLRPLRLALALAVSLTVGSALAQVADPLVGRFSDGWFQIVIGGGGGQYSGQIDVGGQSYPFAAQGSAGRIDGTYQAGGQAFPFAAALQGEVLTLWNETQTFQLTKQAVAAPAPGAAAAQAQGAAAAQPPSPFASGYLAPGTRLTYRHAVASNPGTSAGPEAMGIGGQGFLELDIFYSDDKVCIAKLAMYTQGLMVDSLTRTATEVIVGEGGICSTYWAPPSVLAEYQAPPGGIQTVERGGFDLGGRSYNAIYIINNYENMRLTRVYDLTSGILLTEVEGMGERGYAARENVNPAGSGVQELISVRQVTLPWSVSDPLPANIQNLQSLTYRGEIVTSVPGVYMWDSSISSAYESKFEVQSRGSSWLLGQSTFNSTMPGSNIPLPPTQTQMLLNAASGHFLPVAAMAQLSAGQVLDVDPVTGVRIYVERADQNGVVIVNEGKGFKTSSTYDPRTGLMVAYTSEQMTDGQNMTARQELVGTQ